MRKIERGFIGLGALIGIVLAVLVIAGGAYYLGRQNVAAPQAQQYPDTSTVQAPQQPATPAASAQVAPASTPANTPAPTQTQSAVAVAGMKEYTDANFGFSFWYPSGWTLAQATPQSSDDSGWFKDGKIINTITVHGTRPSNGVTIDEFVSSGLSITELGATMSASPVGEDRTYYFDTTAHTWMDSDLKDNGGKGDISSYPYTTPADISNNTMGGLHVFAGAARFGADVIVPLSADHFLVIWTNDGGGYVDERLLAQTILATDPSVATPLSSSQQVQAIQAEKNGYGSLDDSPLPPSPTITSFYPTTAQPGDTVTIYGTNFTSDTKVEIESEVGMTFTPASLSSTQLTFVVPSSATLAQIKSDHQFPFTISIQNSGGYAAAKNPLVVPGF